MAVLKNVVVWIGVVVMLGVAECRDHLVGGKAGAWKIPSSVSDSLNTWAHKSRFLVGDYLVWSYDGSKEDSVLQVTRQAYLSCNTSHPIAHHTGGHTRLKLHHSGPFYFISGAQAHCDKGEKLIVVVMAHHHLPAPAPAPAALDIAAAAPTAAAAAPGLDPGLYLGLPLSLLVGMVMFGV